MNRRARLNDMESAVPDGLRSVQQLRVELCKNLSQLNVNSKGIGPQRSFKAEDMGEFPTFGLMKRLAKIETARADKEIFSLKQRLATLRKSGLY